MCTFNGEAFLEEQLDSILLQSYPISEFLIFDDCSTDNTAVIIKQYCEKYPFIRFHQNERNLGYNLNFEQALRAAKSEVIAIADQDDYWHREKIAKMIKAWKDDTLMIYCDSFRFTGPIPTITNSNPWYRRFEGTDPRKLFLYNTISGHAMLIKRALLPLVLPFKEGTYYDWWMGVIAACNGGVSYSSDILVYQRVHERNVSITTGTKRSKSKDRHLYKLIVHRHLQQFIKIPNMPAEHRKFGITFYEHWHKSSSQRFHFPLFIFLLKNGTILFWYKKRKVGFISQLKHSFLLTRNPYANATSLL